jgi:cytochrome P450
VVGKAIFGRDLDEAVPVLRDAFPPLSRRAFRRGVAPVRIPASWPTPGNRRAAAAQRALFGVVDRLVAQRRAEPAGQPAGRRSGPPGSPADLLTVLAAARDPESAAAMTPRQVRDEALVFVLAGHETTAVAITFTLHLLARHPAEQGRVATEVRRVLGDRSPTAADLPALVWTTRAVKEALRLYPPAFGTARLLEETEEVAGHRLPARSLVGISIWATHRRPGSWPDPARFDPARFAPEQEQSRHRYAYVPFGGGPRACIGAHFALLEAVVATATVVQRLELTSADGPVRPVVDGITLRPPPGLTVRIGPR